ncbi:MAG: UDPGP type 1 family protein [Phycisphaeraceae bacterium]|nr:UDPGP type 1 family protein [Phycisphaeraceae bacterium]
MTDALDTRYVAARRMLEEAGQAHVLYFWDQLKDEQKTNLLDQIASVDWPEVSRLVKTHVLGKPAFTLPGSIEPSPYYANQPGKGQKQKYQKARKLGEKLIGEGKVAAFTVAGGQGTRLGWNGPKGSYPATPIRKLPLFACMAEYIRKTEQKYQAVVPCYIMTSPINDAATRQFFEQHGYFGLKAENVMMFPQQMMPAFDAVTGKALLESPDTLAMAPNGHGGSLKALFASGAIADMQQRGIEQISYTQVDNPIVKVVDPQFIGLHAMDECQMSSKMLPKAYPKEKLGVFCLVDGKLAVIEYSNLPDDMAEQRDAEGKLRFIAGSIAIHVLRVDFVRDLNTRPGGFALPWNRADKKVACFDLQTRSMVEPKSPNAVKLETFVFDALPLCDKTIVYETDRVQEFAPIKNADAPGTPGAVDCPRTSMDGQTLRAALWLEAQGVKVPRTADGRIDAVIEISPMTAIEADDLKGVDLPEAIDPGTEVLL